MVDPLKITNEIWRQWDKKKITPPMEWYQLRVRVEEALAEKKAPEEIISAFTESNPTLKDLFTGRTLEGYVEAAKVKTLDTFTPWPDMTPEAVVDEAELLTFADWLKAAVKRVWRTKESEHYWEWVIVPSPRGVLVGLAGAKRPHELWAPFIIDLIREKKPGEVWATLYFESPDAAEDAKKILGRQGFHYTVSIKDSRHSIEVEDLDAMLEVLASEGVDTSKIMVERV